jgi:hypothetical protein
VHGRAVGGGSRGTVEWLEWGSVGLGDEPVRAVLVQGSNRPRQPLSGLALSERLGAMWSGDRARWQQHGRTRACARMSGRRASKVVRSGRSAGLAANG